MPVIIPPPTPDDAKYEGELSSKFTDAELWEHICRRIKVFLNCPNWKCHVCGATNFGRNQYCAYCWYRNHVRTNKPEPKG